MTGKVFYVGMGDCYIIVILFYINNFFSTKSLLNYICSIYSELPDVQAEFRKGRGTRDQIANICWIIEKGQVFQRNICFCFIDYAKAFVWITINCGKFLKKWEYQTTLPASWKTYLKVKRQQLEPDMEQWTDSLLGKEYDKAVYILSPCLCNFYNKAVYCHPVYLTSMQSTSWETLDWKKHKLESRLQEKYQ